MFLSLHLSRLSLYISTLLCVKNSSRRCREDKNLKYFYYSLPLSPLFDFSFLSPWERRDSINIKTNNLKSQSGLESIQNTHKRKSSSEQQTCYVIQLSSILHKTKGSCSKPATRIFFFPSLQKGVLINLILRW